MTTNLHEHGIRKAKFSWKFQQAKKKKKQYFFFGKS